MPSSSHCRRTVFSRMLSSFECHIQPAKRAIKYPEKDVWNIFTPLAQKYGSVNLGQGFPNIPIPSFVSESVLEALSENMNQYTQTRGLPELRKELAVEYSSHFNRNIDPDSEILVSIGANQGLSAILHSFINPGDEVILIEPFFDIFKPQVEIIGGVAKSVPLRLFKLFDQNITANDWILDPNDLVRAVGERTKAIILNSPHNPTGKVFSEEELSLIAEIATKHNLLVISDEVYDQIYYGSKRPPSISKQLWRQTITIGSAGKAFGVTGWRVGWIIGPSDLIMNVVKIHSRTVFAGPTPLQSAVAKSFNHARKINFFDYQRESFLAKRDRLLRAFQDLKIPVATPEGSYFFIANLDNLKHTICHNDVEAEFNEPYDYLLCRWLTSKIGITAIPLSPFFETQNHGFCKTWIRICFCKKEDTIEMALDRLRQLQTFLN